MRRSSVIERPRGSAAERPTERLVALPAGDLPQLTGLRFVAALWVLLHHASFLPLGAAERWLEPVRPLLAAGPLGVDLFFVLSGMVLARAYLERWRGAPTAGSVFRYVWARLARVWPLYALVVVGFGVWCLARWVFGSDGVVAWQSVQPGLDASSWLAQLTMTQLWSSPDIEGVSFVLPTWSVSAEFAAYLAFPLVAVVAWWIRGWPRPVLAVAALAVGGAAAAAGLAGMSQWLWAVRLAGGFVAGVLVWLVVRGVAVTPQIARRANTVTLVVLVELVVVVYWAASASPTAAVPAATRLLLAVPLFPVLLGALALGDPARGVAGRLARPAVERGGRRSYALYLVHFPLMEIAMVAITRFPAIGPGTAAAALLVPQLVVLSLVLAAAAHRWVEEPARRWMLAHRPAYDSSPAGAGPAGGATPIPLRRGRRGGSHAARWLPALAR